jgi:hypothetical protein
MAGPYPLLFTVVYTVIDEWYQQTGWRLVRSRPGGQTPLQR